jgi:hypothetical protein
MLRRTCVIIRRVTALVTFLVLPAIAQAQSWSWDARRVGMGGTSGNGNNLASKMIDDQRNYRSIVLPIGFSQVLSNTNRFNPKSKDFDPIMDIEYAATPWHYVIGRNSSSNPGETAFVNDVRNGTLNRDLTKYKGFVPANSFLGEGLVAPSFGHTFKVHKSGPKFQGFYVGVGPYLSVRSQSAISTGLTTVLSTGVNKPNANFPLSEADQSQLAVAVVGGYRARFSLPTSWTGGSGREGLYIAANYNYLRGFGYNHDDLAVALLTDNTGLVRDASNVLVDNRHATKGTGFANDVGVGAVIRRWEVGVGAKGIGNRINWNGVKERTLTLASVVAGNGNFVKSGTVTAPNVRVVLPVDYRANAAYNANRWSAVGEVGHGFGGGSFHGGMEWRANGRFELRAGGRYTLQKWNPTFGVGLNISRKISFDVAAFGTNANIERKHQMAIAASIRFNHYKDEGPKS